MTAVKIGFLTVKVDAFVGETFETLGDVSITTHINDLQATPGPTHFQKGELFLLNGWLNVESRLDLVVVTHMSGTKHIMFADELLSEGKFRRRSECSPRDLRPEDVFI